jgi:hypothetical protein
MLMVFYMTPEDSYRLSVNSSRFCRNINTLEIIGQDSMRQKPLNFEINSEYQSI